MGRPVEHATGAVWIGGFVGAAAGEPLDHAGTAERARSALADAERLGMGHFSVAPRAGA